MIVKLKKIKKLKLNNFLMLSSIMLLTFFIMILSMVLYFNTKAEIRFQNQQSGNVEFNQYSDYIDDNFQTIEKFINYLKDDTSFHKLLNLKIDSIVDKIDKKYSVENHLLNIVKNNDIIGSISLISDKENYFYGTYLLSEELVNKYKNEPLILSYSFNISDSDNQYIGNRQTTDILVNNLDNYSYVQFSFSSISGVNWNVFITFNHKFLFRDSMDSANLAFLSGNDILYKGSVFTPLKDEYLYKINNEAGLPNRMEVHNLNLNLKKLPVNNLTAIYAVDSTKYIYQLNAIRWWILFICIVSLLFSFMVSKLVSVKITSPLQKLTKKLNDYRLDSPDADKKNNYRKLNMKTKLFLYFIFTTVVPLLIYMTLFHIQSENIIKSMITDSSKTIFTKISTQINRTIENKISIIQMLSYDDTIQNFLITPTNYNTDEIDNIIENMRHLGLERDSITFYNSYYSKLYSDRKTKIQNNMVEGLEAARRGILTTHNVDSIGDEFLSFSLPIVSMLSGSMWGSKLGYCRIDSELYRYKEMLQPIEAFGGNAAIIDKNGKYLIYIHKLNLNVNETLEIDNKDIQFIKDGNYLNYYDLLPGTDLFIAAQFDLKEMLNMSRPFLQIYIYLYLMFTMIILIISYFITFKLIKPIAQLNKKINTYSLNERNVFTKDTEKNSYIDEIDSLNSSFIRMSDRIETLVDDLIIANNENNMIALERKNAEMAALQAQINPHFLYNTLNNFIALIRSGKDDEAITAIKLLGSLFKYGISREDVIIPIREELEYAKVYTELIKIRFGDRVSFIWDIQESVFKFSTVKLILQPIIENSIHHGFSAECIKGYVHIRCKEVEKDIVFEVTDNGCGMLPEVLEDINRTLQTESYGNRVGIFNVQGRLKLHYGGSSSVEITSVVGNGTKVTLRIPKRT